MKTPLDKRRDMCILQRASDPNSSLAPPSPRHIRPSSWFHRSLASYPTSFPVQSSCVAAPDIAPRRCARHTVSISSELLSASNLCPVGQFHFNHIAYLRGCGPRYHRLASGRAPGYTEPLRPNSTLPLGCPRYCSMPKSPRSRRLDSIRAPGTRRPRPPHPVPN